MVKGQSSPPGNAQIPKTLVLSRSIPPAISGSSTIMGNLGRQFTREEMVIVGARLLGSPPIIWRPEWPRIHYATVIPPRSWRGARWIHWFQFPWLVFYTLILSLFARTRVLLVVFPDEIYLLAGYITSVLTRKPLILYFHNTYLELRSANRLARWLQPRAFRRAQHVFVMSEGMQRFYQQRYPDLRCSPLVHTFNEPLPHFDDLGSALDDLHDPLQLALSGNINASNGGAVQHMAEAIKALPNTQMLIYSGTAPKYLERLGLVGESFSVASLERDALLQALSGADIMLLPHGFSSMVEEEIATIFPTRTIEYLIAGKPILAHVPDDCFLAEFLRSRGCALIVTEPDPGAIQAGILRLKSDQALRRQLVRQALQAAEQFYAPTVTAYLREVIGRIVES